MNQIVRRSLEQTSETLIIGLQKQPSEASMIEYLKQQEVSAFFRMSVINQQYLQIYDTHLARKIDVNFQYFYPAEHPEVKEAMQMGKGYAVGHSALFNATFAYVGMRFYVQGHPYVLRTAFPFDQVQILSRNFRLGLFGLDLVLFVCFSATSWFFFSRISRPIREIIEAIKPYQEGKQDMIPDIELVGTPDDEFVRLAKTLNSLSRKIRTQIACVLEEKYEKETILESLGEGVIAVDQNLIVRYLNQAAAKLFGISRRKILGKMLVGQESAVCSELWERCYDLLRRSVEQNEILTDAIAWGEGQKTYLDLIAVPKPLRSGSVIVLQDKSSHYRVLEIGKDFVANASHELKTPITIIRGFAETLQDLEEVSPQMLAEITEKIVRNCQRMDTLVKNLLTLADIENIPVSRFQNSDLVALVDDCKHMLLVKYPRAEVIVHKSAEHIMAFVDPDLIELAIINLLDNAAKYSPDPAKIAVFIAEHIDDVQLRILDQGVGIAANDIEHIFERFYTVNKAHSRKLGGAGLGLSIVKTIIEKHEGSISVFSQPNQGTEFVILLPKCSPTQFMNTSMNPK